MYHKFSQVSGQLRPSTQFEAFNPQGFRPLNIRSTEIIVDSPSMTKMPKEIDNTRGMATKATRPLGTIPAAPGYKKIQEMQNIMTRQDGLLVWQKLPKDRMMYGFTMAACVVGFAFTVKTLWTMSFPRKVE